MIAAIASDFVRIAYPLRSRALSQLADSPKEADALAALMMGMPTAEPYVEQPFRVPAVSRFSNGSYGVLYAGDTLRTAVKEKAYHLARYFADAAAPPQSTRQTRLTLHVVGNVRDVRRSVGDASVPDAIYDPTDYAVAQKFGAELRMVVPGVHYDSVRNPLGGHCVGAFTPSLVKHAAVVGEVRLVWDGRRFSEEHTVEQL